LSDIKGLELRSIVDAEGSLTLRLEEVTYPAPADDEVLVRVEAAPINPSDLGLLLGPADVTTLEEVGAPDAPALRFSVPRGRMGGLRARIGQSLPVGNEGAGTVIDAGENGRDLIGRKVGMMGGGMYAQYRKLTLREIVPLPEGASAADGAAMFVNPLTALAFVETMRMEGHKAIVHTAAASNLGQMLQRICLADGVPLVNIVRSAEQARILTDIGATRGGQQRRRFPPATGRCDRRHRRDHRIRRDRRRDAGQRYRAGDGAGCEPLGQRV